MLGTLMKYEFKAVGRLLLPLYAAWFIAAILLGLSLGGDGTDNSPLFITLSGILYGGACVSAIILTVIILIQRFYKNLLGNEGYLMFALPVSTGRHLTSKVISGAVWSVAGVLVGLLTTFAIIISLEGFSSFLDELRFMVGDVQIMLREEPAAILSVFELILVVLVFAASIVVRIYASIAIGHQWGNHRVLGAILAYIGFGIIESLIGNLISRLPYTSLPDFIIEHGNNLSPVAQLNLSLLFVLIIVTFVTAIYWFIAWKLLNSKLNLE